MSRSEDDSSVTSSSSGRYRAGLLRLESPSHGPPSGPGPAASASGRGLGVTRQWAGTAMPVPRSRLLPVPRGDSERTSHAGGGTDQDEQTTGTESRCRDHSESRQFPPAAAASPSQSNSPEGLLRVRPPDSPGSEPPAAAGSASTTARPQHGKARIRSIPAMVRIGPPPQDEPETLNSGVLQLRPPFRARTTRKARPGAGSERA